MNITQEDINQYAINGGNFSILQYEQIAAIAQEFINEYVANGGDLRFLSDSQFYNIPQSAINQNVANGGNLSSLSKKQIDAVPRTILAERGRNEEYKIHLAPPNIKAIQSASQNDINEFIVRCGNDYHDLKLLSNKQRANLPQYNINQYFANTGYLADSQLLSDEQRNLIPQVIMTISDNAKESLILYAAGKIDKKYLPTDVYVNHEARKILLSIIKFQTTAKFNDICRKNGYVDNVPKIIVDTFDKKLDQIEKEVQEKNKTGVKELTEKQASTIKEINELEW